MIAPARPPEPPAPPADDVRTTRTLLWLARRFRDAKGGAALALSLLLSRTAAELSMPPLIAAAIDSLMPFEGRGGPLPQQFRTVLWVLAGVMVLRVVLQYLVAVATARVGQDLENRLRSELFAKVTALRFTWHDENRSGKTIARSLRDMEKAKHFFREVAFGYVEAGLLALGVMAITFAYHWTYGLLVTMAVAAALALTFRTGVRIARMDKGASDEYDRVTTVLQENVAGARVVRAFGREPEESDKFGGRLGRFSGSWKGLSRYWTGVMPWVGHIYLAVVPIALMLGAWRLSRGEGSVREVVAVILLVRTASARLRPLTRLVILGQEAVASAVRVHEVLERDDVIASPLRRRRLPTRHEGIPAGDLRFEDVSFSHPRRGLVLHALSLHVPAGTSLGLLGPTGSGKTSLVQLVPRFYDPQQGRVLVDDVDVRDLDVRELRAAVGLVFQEPFLFSATVAENIAYGRPDVTRERIVECARLAAAHEFVLRLPKGYETMVGERGVSLSGGQRQRLAIARALAMDPRVLIFDDATASVDAVTERELFDGIRSAARGRTTLVISQRVTSIKWCDRIAVLEDGRITGVGTHDELLGRNELYREIHRHQQLTGAAGAVGART